MVETEELKPKPRADAARSPRRFRPLGRRCIDDKPQGELAEMILEESGYTDMWRQGPHGGSRRDGSKI